MFKALNHWGTATTKLALKKLKSWSVKSKHSRFVNLDRMLDSPASVECLLLLVSEMKGAKFEWTNMKEFKTLLIK